jgi:trehalose-phosphatase
MRGLDHDLKLDRFFHRLARASSRILFADYDGTLAPFTSQADRAAPYPGVAQLLNEIAQAPGSHVVLVSGRRLADMSGPLSHICAGEVWASHGWQHSLRDGPQIDYVPDEPERSALDDAERHARALEALGARVERKAASVAVHWRGLDEISADVIEAELRHRWPSYEKRGLDILEFEQGIELRSVARTKADAVSETLAARGQGAVCAFLGDDLTDEDGFRAVRGRGIGVLVRPAWRRTHADLWLQPPRDVIGFLSRWRASTSAS